LWKAWLLSDELSSDEQRPASLPPAHGSAEAEANDSSWARGLELRRAVLGSAHVERALAAATDFDRDFQSYITRSAWGEIWTRPGLPLQTRHLLTIVMLATLNRQEELEMHLAATRNTGLTPEEVREALMHVAVYAGVPAANAALKTAKRVLFAAPAGAEGREAAEREAAQHG
jgi:4-carboxymuconolactone decarboxylase